MLAGYTKAGLLRVDVDAQYKPPKGYGIAYYRYDCYKVVCYPLGINWIVWLFREIYFRILYAPKGIEHKSYNIGYNDGLKVGIQVGKINKENNE